MTVILSGRVKTDELNDLAGKLQGLLTLDRAAVLERRALRVAVRAS
jgi:hypothetical protein